MSNSFDDIDALIARIQDTAQQYQHRPEQPLEAFAYRQDLGELLEPPEEVRVPGDPRHPELAELVVPSRSDEEFLDNAYQRLMGRDPDSEGREHYLVLLPIAGRLFVLAELLGAEEAHHYLAQHEIRIAARRWLRLPLRLHARLGALGSALERPVQMGYRVASILLRPTLRRREGLSRLQALETLQGWFHDRIRHLALMLDGELNRQAQEIIQQREHARAQEARLNRSLQRIADQERRAGGSDKASTVEPAVEQHKLDDYYLAFEAIFRGDETQIREHLNQYQPQLQQALEVGTRALDLGCGRGEWLRLLAQEGFDPHGVDLSPVMVEHCREKGFEVTHSDLLSVLRAQPDQSHALVSAFHIAEHLPFDVLYAMVEEVARVLASGGVLIIETPNPENVLVGSHTFYHDPTHRNPLTPTSLCFLLEYHGFEAVNIRRFNPYPESAKVPGSDPLTERVNGHLCGPQDYAVVATLPQEQKPGQERVIPNQEDQSA